MLTELSLAMVVLLAVAAIAVDAVLGEPSRWHPLVGFGQLANAIECRLNRGRYRHGRGMLAWLLAVVPITLLAYGLALFSEGISVYVGAGLHILMLYFGLGLRSLHDHTFPIQQALMQNDVMRARQLTSCIVSRDTTQAETADLSKAAVESLLENGNDAVFGTLFWFVVAGGPGAVLFRLANTLDAMWGYRSSRYLAFGCVAARIDDVLNWLPARLTALSYALLGNTRTAWRCWRTQAPHWPSPNAGPVMAAGAGALKVTLGGVATYGGVVETRPSLGAGEAATATDIGRAWRLVAGAVALWIGVLALAAVALSLLTGDAHA